MLSTGTSLPSLGAWIETTMRWSMSARTRRRSLHWERGLKQSRIYVDKRVVWSLPSLGAWIET